MAEMRPTPIPAKKRPALKRGREVAAVCMATPKLKIQQAEKSPHFLPILSAKRGEDRAPKKVPTERMETIMALWEVSISGSPSVGFMYPVEN